MEFQFLYHAHLVDHVSYKVPQPIHWPMHWSIYWSLLDQPSTDTQPTCRSTDHRESTDVLVELPLMSAEVSRDRDHIESLYRSTSGKISVNYRQNVSRAYISFNSQARVYRYYGLSGDLSTDTIDQYIDLY